MARSRQFHEGELQAQRNAREEEAARRNGAGVVDHIRGGALAFVRQQTIAYAASIDVEKRVWASMLLGAPGFLQPSDDAHALSISLNRMYVQALDPLWENLKHDKRLGLLLLEPQTRRRLKINGKADVQFEQLILTVEESVAVCPRYIQRRTISFDEPGALQSPADLNSGVSLGASQLQSIMRADTFFLASAHHTHGADCSHRGGPPGFVRVLDNGVLRIPDYNGNSMFNSVGNFLQDPHAGLLFADYERRFVLQLSGFVEVSWNQPDAEGQSGGTGRFLHFSPTCWIETPLPASLHSNFIDFSPFLPVKP